MHTSKKISAAVAARASRTHAKFQSYTGHLGIAAACKRFLGNAHCRSRMRADYLLSDDCGAALIELAIVAPVLAFTAIGVVDMSNAYGREMSLKQGSQRAIERVMQ